MNNIIKSSILSLLVLGPSMAIADSARISVVPPTNRADGTVFADTEVASYTVRFDGVEQSVLPDALPLQIDNLSVGEHCVEVSVRDIYGYDSPFSDAQCIHALAVPGAPVVTIEIIRN